MKKVFSVLFLSSLFVSLQGVGFSQEEYEAGQKRVLLLMKARELLDRSPVEGRDAAEQDVRKAERSLRRRSSLTPRLSQKDLEKMRTMHEREEQARANVAEGFESPQMGSVSSEDAVQ